MSVRAKFTVTATSQTIYGGNTVTLNPVTSGSEENDKFFQYTPAGSIQMTITTDAAKQFELGKDYYVDFTPATAPALDVQNCASCGNDHESVPATAASTDGGTFQCPDSGNTVSYTNDEAQTTVPDPRNTI